MIEIVVENCGAVIKRMTGDGDALSDVLLGLENVVSKLIDLAEKLRGLKEVLRFSQCQESSRRFGHGM